MSFSSIIKNELCRLEAKGKCCMLSELSAVIRISGTLKVVDQGLVNIKITTENAAFARRVFSMIKKTYNLYPEVLIRKSKKLKKHVAYILVITASMGTGRILEDAGIHFVNREKQDVLLRFHKNCCKKAYLRGAFLAGGSISDPEKTYHLEINHHTRACAEEVCDLVGKFGLNAKVIQRKGSFVTYLKEGENIVDFLNIVGAHTALLEMENIRILKEMRNNVNRIVNCETANLDKTINASFRQIENIKYIRDHIGFDYLPKSLREMAELRLEYSDNNLKELGTMLTPPLGKSGVNHRLRKLDKIAEDARMTRGEIIGD